VDDVLSLRRWCCDGTDEEDVEVSRCNEKFEGGGVGVYGWYSSVLA